VNRTAVNRTPVDQMVVDRTAVDHIAAAVTTHALVRDYGDGAGLLGIDLEVPKNAVYGLVGKNGAGKTTLLSILAGLRKADSGEIRLNVADGRVAMCPDTPAFEPWLTASEVVRQSLGLVSARRSEIGRAHV
jgi:ABC-2 type transport system ATP-binding protein